MKLDTGSLKFLLRPFLGSCLLVLAALVPHAPLRDILMGFVLAAGIGLITLNL
jgi:hypothetical protein